MTPERMKEIRLQCDEGRRIDEQSRRDAKVHGLSGFVVAPVVLNAFEVSDLLDYVDELRRERDRLLRWAADVERFELRTGETVGEAWPRNREYEENTDDGGAIK